MSLRVAMLSVHTCPLAALGGKETGGMNVYVREVSRELGRMGVAVDVFTRSQNPSIPRVVPLGERARVAAEELRLIGLRQFALSHRINRAPRIVAIVMVHIGRPRQDVLVELG